MIMANLSMIIVKNSLGFNEIEYFCLYGIFLTKWILHLHFE